jgi:hypothetical protein
MTGLPINMSEFERYAELISESVAATGADLGPMEGRQWVQTPDANHKHHANRYEPESPCKAAGWTERMQKRMRRWVQSMSAGRRRLFGPDAGTDQADPDCSRDSTDRFCPSEHNAVSPEAPSVPRTIGLTVLPSEVPVLHHQGSVAGHGCHGPARDSDRDASRFTCEFHGAPLDKRDDQRRDIRQESRETERHERIEPAPRFSNERVAEVFHLSPPLVAGGSVSTIRGDACIHPSQNEGRTSFGISAPPRFFKRSSASNREPHPVSPGSGRVATIDSSRGSGRPRTTASQESRSVPADYDVATVRRCRLGDAGPHPQATMEHSASALPEGEASALPCARFQAPDPPLVGRKMAAAPSESEAAKSSIGQLGAASRPSRAGERIPITDDATARMSCADRDEPPADTKLQNPPRQSALPSCLLLRALMESRGANQGADGRTDPRARSFSDATRELGWSRRTDGRKSPSSAEQKYPPGLRFRSSVPKLLAETVSQAVSSPSPLVALLLPLTLPPHAMLAWLCHRCNAFKRTRVLIVFDDTPASDLNASCVHQTALEMLAYLRAALGTSIAVATSLAFDPNATVGVLLASSSIELSTTYRAVHVGMVVLLLAGNIQVSKKLDGSAMKSNPERFDTWIRSWPAVPPESPVLLMPLLPNSVQAIQRPCHPNAGQWWHLNAFQHLLYVVNTHSMRPRSNAIPAVTTPEASSSHPMPRPSSQLWILNPDQVDVQMECSRYRRQTLQIASYIKETDAVFVLVHDGEHLLHSLMGSALSDAIPAAESTIKDATLPCGCLFLQHPAADYDRMVREIDNLLRQSGLRRLAGSVPGWKRHQRPLREDAHQFMALHALRQAVTISCYDGPDAALIFLNQACQEYSRFYGVTATSVRLIERSTLRFFERVRATPSQGSPPLVPLMERVLTDLKSNSTDIESSTPCTLIVTDSPASAVALSTWAASQLTMPLERETALGIDSSLTSLRPYETPYGKLAIRSIQQLLKQMEWATSADQSDCTFQSYSRVVLVAPSARMGDLAGRAQHWSDRNRGAYIRVHFYACISAPMASQASPLSFEQLESEYNALFRELVKHQVMSDTLISMVSPELCKSLLHRLAGVPEPEPKDTT